MKQRLSESHDHNPTPPLFPFLTSVEHGRGPAQFIVGNVLLPLLAVRKPRHGEGVHEVEGERLVVANLPVTALLQRKRLLHTSYCTLCPLTAPYVLQSCNVDPESSPPLLLTSCVNNVKNPMRHLQCVGELAIPTTHGLVTGF